MRLLLPLLMTAMVTAGCGPTTSLSPNLAGTVINTRGSVEVQRGGMAEGVAIGDPIYLHDRLMTKDDGSVQVNLEQASIAFSLGADSQAVVESIEPLADAGVALSVMLDQGRVRVRNRQAVTPPAVFIETPSAEIQARVAEFLVSCDKTDSAALAEVDSADDPLAVTPISMPQQASGRTTVTVWNGLVSVRPLGADLPWVGPPQRRRVTVANGTFVGSVPVQLVDSETLAQLDRETRIYTLPKVFMERLRETMQARDQARRTGGQAVAQANPLMPPAAGLAAGVDASAVPAHVEEEDDVAGPEKAAADTEDETADVEIITPAATNDDATSEDVVEDTGNVPAQEDETAEAADDVVADDMLMPLPPMAEETDDAASEDAAEEAGDDVEDDAAAEVEDAADAAEEDEEDSAEPVKEDEEDGFGEWQIPLMPAEE